MCKGQSHTSIPGSELCVCVCVFNVNSVTLAVILYSTKGKFFHILLVILMQRNVVVHTFVKMIKTFGFQVYIPHILIK